MLSIHIEAHIHRALYRGVGRWSDCNSRAKHARYFVLTLHYVNYVNRNMTAKIAYMDADCIKRDGHS